MVLHYQEFTHVFLVHFYPRLYQYCSARQKTCNVILSVYSDSTVSVLILTVLFQYWFYQYCFSTDFISTVSVLISSVLFQYWFLQYCFSSDFVSTVSVLISSVVFRYWFCTVSIPIFFNSIIGLIFSVTVLVINLLFSVHLIHMKNSCFFRYICSSRFGLVNLFNLNVYCFKKYLELKTYISR